MTFEPPDYFEPESGVVVVHLLIVRDVDRSREFYQRVMGVSVLRDRGPCVMRFANSYIVLNDQGGPTDDKPDVSATAPQDATTLSSALNIRVRDIRSTYTEPNGQGAEASSLPSPRTTVWKSDAICATPTTI